MVNEKKKVVIVGAIPPPANGMTVFTQMLLDSELRQQFQIKHLDTSYPSGIPNMGRLRMDALVRTFLQIKQFRSLLRGFQPQITYMPISYTPLGLLRVTILIWMAHRRGVCVIVHLHNNDKVFQTASPFVRGLLKIACRYIDRAVVVHSMYQNAFAPFLSTGQVVAIPNGIPDIAISPNSGISERRPRPGSVRQILFLSNLQREKGFLDLLHAIPLIRTRHSQTKFIMAGNVFEPDAVKEAREFLRSHDLVDAVDWRGSVVGEAKSSLFRQSDVFVFPTYYHAESFGLVMLEAMAMGLPIVATDHMAIPQIAVHGRNGLIVPKQDPASLAQAIISLLDDDGLRERIGQINRSEYLEKYTEEKCIQRIGDLFRQVLTGG